jgi:hypothetical protein
VHRCYRCLLSWKSGPPQRVNQPLSKALVRRTGNIVDNGVCELQPCDVALHNQMGNTLGYGLPFGLYFLAGGVVDVAIFDAALVA